MWSTGPAEAGDKTTGVFAHGHLTALGIRVQNRFTSPIRNRLTSDRIDHRRKALTVVDGVLAVTAIAWGNAVWETSRDVANARARLVLTERI
jgi:hypothetical protein